MDNVVAIRDGRVSITGDGLLVMCSASADWEAGDDSDLTPVRVRAPLWCQRRWREPRATAAAVERATARVHSHDVRGCHLVVSPHTTHARAQARLLVLPVIYVVLK